ncbi:hypothetical protein PUN28_015983 [Cardiocondyla obscurior]|uniref:J domain-containing protein n=1 Tax=Cardiocondyla obscurior TaxID=286306 RepID=A0AAW2EWB1_9HYME
MHTVFEQSFFKLNMLPYTKLQLVRFYSIKQSSKKNLYDILNITPRATQNEIKTAYYKLTLQYHPDKNDSEYAKQKFQDISEAYEVLSNYEQRKIYDRNTLLHRQPTMSTTTEQPMSYYKDKVYSGSSKIYNFDEWTKAHYGQQIKLTRERRESYERSKKNDYYQKDRSYAQISLLILTVTIVAAYFREKTDIPVFKKPNKETKNNGN